MIPRSVPPRFLALALLLIPVALPAADAAKAPKGAGKKAGPAAPALRIICLIHDCLTLHVRRYSSMFAFNQ